MRHLLEAIFLLLSLANGQYARRIRLLGLARNFKRTPLKTPVVPLSMRNVDVKAASLKVIENAFTKYYRNQMRLIDPSAFTTPAQLIQNTPEEQEDPGYLADTDEDSDTDWSAPNDRNT